MSEAPARRPDRSDPPGAGVVRLLMAADPSSTRGALARLAASGAAGAVQFAVLNQVVLHSRSTSVQVIGGLVFTALIAASVHLRSNGAARLVATLERSILQRRRQLFEAILRTDLRTFERLGDLAPTLRRDMDEVVALGPVMVDCLFYGVMLTAVAAYLITLSTTIAFVWGIAMGLLVWDMRRQRGPSDAAVAGLDAAWRAHRHRVAQLTAGFAQLKMDRAARRALRAEIADASTHLAVARRRRFSVQERARIVAGTVVYLGLGVVLFSEPIAATLPVATRFEVIIVMFVSATTTRFLVHEVEAFATADAALDRIARVEASLLAGAGPQHRSPRPADAFERIEFDGVRFAYGAGDFAVGPLDFHLRPGEVVFITGGNGSGKTTAMKVLTGLYTPARGRVRLDGRSLSGQAWERYRTLFTTVFMDHHLFGPAFGLDVSDRERVDALLDRFNLGGIVHFDGERFAPLDLSTGQRKRLAMVVALLEDRPIYVLDEWAAHQDPYLRRYFYETLLPELRAAGRAVVAISHDARFFHLADRRLHLENGRLVPAPGREPSEPRPKPPG